MAAGNIAEILRCDQIKDLTSFIALTRQMVRTERSRHGMSFRATLQIVNWENFSQFFKSFLGWPVQPEVEWEVEAGVQPMVVDHQAAELKIVFQRKLNPQDYFSTINILVDIFNSAWFPNGGVCSRIVPPQPRLWLKWASQRTCWGLWEAGGELDKSLSLSANSSEN